MRAKAYAKVNIFLKITGYQDGYHTILSRFVKVKSLFDTIEFVPCECESFTIEGCEGIPLESNTIYRAYKALNSQIGDLDILDFFYHHKVVVEKNIPSQAGLGGGSSDAGVFINMVKEACNLKIDTDRLAQIASSVGADVPFFVYGYDSANVSGFGEIIEEFEDDDLDIEIFTPDIECNTAKVYQQFKQNYLKDIEVDSFFNWRELKSKDLISNIKDRAILNDLYRPATDICPRLKDIDLSNDWLFSGSGSSFFRVK